MMHLLFKMGSLPATANAKEVKIIRLDGDRRNEIKVDARKILMEGNPEDDVPLKDGDRVVVPSLTSTAPGALTGQPAPQP